jgi:hypothetical protein
MTNLSLAITDADLQALGLAVITAAAADEDRMHRALMSESDDVPQSTSVASAISEWAIGCIKARPEGLSVEDAANDMLDFLQAHSVKKRLAPSALRYLISCVKVDERAAS